MIAERNYKKLEKQQEILLWRSNYVLEKKKRMRFLKLDLKWSIECPFCYCLHLNCTVKEERRQCCNFGEMINNPDKSKFCLKPIGIFVSWYIYICDVLYDDEHCSVSRMS